MKQRCIVAVHNYETPAEEAEITANTRQQQLTTFRRAPLSVGLATGLTEFSMLEHCTDRLELFKIAPFTL